MYKFIEEKYNYELQDNNGNCIVFSMSGGYWLASLFHIPGDHFVGEIWDWSNSQGQLDF